MTKNIYTDLNATGRTITAGGLSLPSTTSTITLNSSVGASGQVLTSAGSGSTPTWTNVGYTALVGTPYAIVGTQPSFTSIPATYKKLVVQIKFDNIGSLSGTFYMSVNSNSSVSYTTYTTGSSSASVSTSNTSGIPLTTTSASPTTTNIYTVEIPNYTSPNPTMWLSGGVGGTTNASRFGAASTTSAITQISFQAATSNSWTGATGTIWIYGVN